MGLDQGEKAFGPVFLYFYSSVCLLANSVMESNHHFPLHFSCITTYCTSSHCFFLPFLDLDMTSLSPCCPSRVLRTSTWSGSCMVEPMWQASSWSTSATPWLSNWCSAGTSWIRESTLAQTLLQRCVLSKTDGIGSHQQEMLWFGTEVMSRDP